MVLEISHLGEQFPKTLGQALTLARITEGQNFFMGNLQVEIEDLKWHV